MKIELIPEIRVTTEEKSITDQFCKICENFTEVFDDYYDCNDIYLMIKDNTGFDWDDFLDYVRHFSDFIKSCEED